MTVYGYARVSSNSQELAIQLAELRCAGCTRIFCEKESGIKEQRREMERLLRLLRPRDTVIVSALDRLTRAGPYKMLCALQEFTSRGVSYKSLAEPWADTTQELGEVLAALVGYVARKTREDILRRTKAGRERAKALGVKFGRRPKLSPSQRQQALARRTAGEASRSIAADFNVSSSTISRLRVPPVHANDPFGNENSARR